MLEGLVQRCKGSSCGMTGGGCASHVAVKIGINSDHVHVNSILGVCLLSPAGCFLEDQ
jgi:hypothetical protein